MSLVLSGKIAAAYFYQSDLMHGMCAVTANEQDYCRVTSLIFGNFYFDYYSYMLGLRLGLGLGFYLFLQNVCAHGLSCAPDQAFFLFFC